MQCFACAMVTLRIELLLAGYTESNSGLPIKDMLEKNIGKTNGAGSSADAD